MTRPATILITGAAGNLGSKLQRHLQGRYSLRLFDQHQGNEQSAIEMADLSRWNPNWVERFAGVDVVVHLAADPTAQQTWPNLIAPNVDALINVLQACVLHNVPRIVYASSNHVMGGYKDVSDPWLLTTTLPPRPGAQYVVAGEQRDSTPYASAKLFGERLGCTLSTATNLSVLAIRIGWVQNGDNRPQDIPSDRDPWFRLMWLSNRDYLQVMEKCLIADPTIRFAVLNAMSANTGMRWDLSETCRILGYEPVDDVTA